MNLSKFYKDNEEFKPAILLERNLHNIGPVWESIVKKPEVTIAEEDNNTPVDTPLETEQNSDAEVDAQATQLQFKTTEQETEQKSPPSTLSSDPSTLQQPTPVPAFDIEEIRENAYNSGISIGRKQAEEDFENGAQTLLCVCNELDSLRETILKNSIGEMRELVLAISEKIIRHSVEGQTETITNTIKEAIQLAVKSDEFQIRLNPDDLACIESKKSEIISQISGLDSILLKPDATLERGGCKIESSCCTIDASMASQLKVIRDSVMTSAQMTGNIDS